MINAVECVERRRDWMKRAVSLVRPYMQERTGLIVPPVNIDIVPELPMNHKMIAVALPPCDNRNKPLILFRDEDHSVKPWIALGTVIHECIHVAGIWNHYAGFGKAARQMQLSGRLNLAGFDKISRLNDLPIYARGILSRMDMYPPVIRDLRSVWIEEHARDSQGL